MHQLDQLGKQINAIEHQLDLWIKKLGLSYNSFAVLYALAAAENGQCTQKHICDEWLLPKQTVFNVCKEYKEAGLIELHESPHDKRERIMRLTPAGQAKALPVWQATRALSARIFQAFGEEQSAQLFALLAGFCQVCGQEIERTTPDADAGA